MTDKSLRALKANGFGKNFEKHIKMACFYYEQEGLAHISKVDEPFRVIRLQSGGRFIGQFTGAANPDFEGTLKGGRSICFEAKRTQSDRLSANVISDKQYEILEAKYRLGGLVGVCAEIKDRFYFIPWEIFRDMKARFGRKYVKHEDIKNYQIPFRKGPMFLNNIGRDDG